MIDRKFVAEWLDRYVAAWRSYDPNTIGALFADDVRYYYTPYADPLIGREAVVKSWLENQEPPQTWEAHYEPIAVDGQTVVANGLSRYYEDDGTTFRAEWDNIFVLRFDEHGQCIEFCDWYMKKPEEKASN